nr:Protoporphyrinogen IX oxidase, aerobic, HemY (EC 1.3.3.4) [Kibdelosporangium sp. MJ126-NF4]
MCGVKRTAVIGGGMAGCAAAKELVGKGHDVTVFESGDGLGGRARSWHRSEIEPSVGINLMCASIYDLMWQRVREYGLEDQLVEISSNLLVVDNGVAASLPSDSPKAVLSYQHAPRRDRFAFVVNSLKEFFLNRKKIDLFDAEKLAAFDSGDSAVDYGRKFLSQRGFDYMLRAQIEGFWNFRCEDISAAHAKALLATMGGVRFYVFANGMQVLAERNAEGADVRLEHEVTDVRQTGDRVELTWRAGDDVDSDVFDNVVLATPAPIAAKLTAALPEQWVDADTRRFLETQEYEPALSVSYLVDRGNLPSTTHLMAGGSADPKIRNMIIYPRMAGDQEKFLVFAYPGRAITRSLLGKPAEQQFATVTPLLKTMVPDFPADPEPFQIAERPYGFPIPAPGRYRWSVRVSARQRPPVVYAGDYFSAPTTEAAMLAGHRAAASVAH